MEISHGHTIVVRPLGEGTEWKRDNEAGDPVALYRVSGIEVPVVMPWLDGPLLGTTVDLSEAGPAPWSTGGGSRRSRARAPT